MKRRGSKDHKHLSDGGRSSSALRFERHQILPDLQRRDEVGSLRHLQPFHKDGSIDFSSNDYLGLSRNQEQHEKVEQTLQRLREKSDHNALLGSTGSRLLTGDSEYAHKLERRLAQWHKRPAALLCNSGYDANLSVLSCLTRNTVVIMDELSHNSLRMGVRLSKDCTVETFVHNDLVDLQRLLQIHSSSTRSFSKHLLVVVESVYSMDGDLAPLREILDLASDYNACVIVDEAHGLGVFGSQGMGVLERDGLENHPALLLSVHTFGKAAGCHGAVVCGSKAVKEYLLNYGRPIIYSTSLPIHSLVTIACSYQSMAGPLGDKLREIVNERVQIFRRGMARIMSVASPTISLVDSISPIQALIIPGNAACVQFCKILWNKSNGRVRLYPIRSPTVPVNHERVRIIIHAHNTTPEISNLLLLAERTLRDMGYLIKEMSKL